jgi:hypothetical protein
LFLKECLSWYDLTEKYHCNFCYEEQINVYNRRGYQQTVAEDQGSTETNQQQPTDIAQKNHKRTWTTRTPDESEMNSGGPEE